jgi:hypothetical protein
MKNKKKIIKNPKQAFDFIQKLYFKTSYLIKEIEGMLAEEEEKFVIGKNWGTQISTRISRGIEATNVPHWIVGKMAVFYIPQKATRPRSDKICTQTFTKFGKKLKLIYLRFVLNEKAMKEPYLYVGVLHDIIKKTQPNEYPRTFERAMDQLEYNDSKVFKKLNPIRYEDQYIKLKGKLSRVNLFDINDSDDIRKKIIQPAVKLFRAI